MRIEMDCVFSEALLSVSAVLMAGVGRGWQICVGKECVLMMDIGGAASLTALVNWLLNISNVSISTNSSSGMLQCR